MKEIIKDLDKLSSALETDNVPSFHDAEIISILINRELLDQEIGVSLKVEVLIYKLFEEFEKEGKKFKRFNNAVAAFKFLESKFEQLEYFNHQNVINDLHISQIENSDKYSVHFESIYGCDLRFECKEIELIEVRTFETEEKAFHPDLEQIKRVAELRKRNLAKKISEETS